ncbi:organic cation transporter protein-like isoform X2 [Hyposmocoma kahamanoa]|uniref:organic cation transporter protein-like isoform X2 n=1 Tax=Hyposmocoma kahamanoa TaxID=1477025 RepID=UPI000E6D7C81|nr:organic cation transporter protein-like isoform X2 [Hyposmocoma kahamanoa]
MGPAGKFQLRNFSLILVPVIVMAMYNGQYIFNAAKPNNQRCMVRECENTPPVFKTGEWKTWAIPDDPQKARCFRYANQEGQCKKESFSKDLMKCDSWLYEDYNSIVAEFDLGCQEWKRTLVGTIHGLGLMTALAFIGTLSDLCGRRYTFIVTSSLPSVLGIVRGLSNSYYMYLAFEYLEALVASGSYSTGYILALEMIGVEKRVLASSCLSCSFAIGQILLAFLAWILPYWRNLTFLLYTPGILFVTYYFCLVESVRWLVSQGRKKEAADIIFKGAAVNKRTLPPDTIAYLETMSSVVPIKTRKKSIMTETKIIFRSRILFSRLIVISFWFAAVTFIYYGLSINAVSLTGNQYLNYALLSVIEIPGYIINIFTLDHFGRKKTITSSYLISATALTIMPFIINMGPFPTIMVLVAKMFISIVFSATYLYVTELTPTEVRHTMMGLSLFIGRLGKSSAPLSPLLVVASNALSTIRRVQCCSLDRSGTNSLDPGDT